VRVSARGRTWVIDRVHRYARCTRLDLRGARVAAALLHPFDRFEAIAAGARWRHGGLNVTGARVFEAAVAGTSLAALEGGPAPLALPDWQFAVARAFESGAATRVLLADAVGLGKTTQAGLAVAALRSHGILAHALVLAPAGLRDQWVDELGARLGLRAWTADPAGWRAARATLPPGVSAWAAHPLVVTSIDYVKQPDVLAAAAAVAWDLVVVDEAHNVGPGSDRRVAADTLAARSARVLLVTATPHAGDDEAFEALCAIGAHGPRDQPPLLVRRRREEAGLTPASRLRVVRVPPSVAERAMHDALSTYARQVWDERQPGAPLAMAWLAKRAASSPLALWRSVERRRSLIAPAGPSGNAVTWLPFEDEVDERDEGDDRAPATIGSPGLADRERELRLLDDLACRAGLAARTWRKGERLVRWLLASDEPVVLFTEYRDTLSAFLAMLPPSCPVAVLHGGLGRAARSEALGRFLRGEARLLATTDVAGEGLNLQGAARTVVSMEVPWTPTRLEQRVGRVDRIGQARRVRAACLVGRDGPEERVLARVEGRAQRATAALERGSGHRPDDLALLAAALGLDAAPPRMSAPARTGDLGNALEPDPGAGTAARAWLVRRAAADAGHWSTACDAPGRDLPWVRLGPGRSVVRLPEGIVMVFLVQALAADGRVSGETAVALHATLAPESRRLPRRHLLRGLASALAPHAARAAEVPLSAAVEAFRQRTRAEIDRLALDDPVEVSTLVQPSLFDRRAIVEAATRQAVRAARVADREDRIARLESELAPGSVTPPMPVAAFVCW
jgi:superfamily II DNA or RNA helicase